MSPIVKRFEFNTRGQGKGEFMWLSYRKLQSSVIIEQCCAI